MTEMDTTALLNTAQEGKAMQTTFSAIASVIKPEMSIKQVAQKTKASPSAVLAYLKQQKKVA